MSDSPVTSGGAIPDDAFKYPTILKVHLLLNHTPPAHTPLSYLLFHPPLMANLGLGEYYSYLSNIYPFKGDQGAVKMKREETVAEHSKLGV